MSLRFSLPLPLLACLAMLPAVFLGGCADSSSLFFGTVKDLYASGSIGGAKDRIPARPDPRYRYLRVEVKGNPPAMLVLGFIDPHPDGPVEVWYSADKETLRTQNGRIVGLSGSAKDWLNVQLSNVPTHWTDIGADGASFERRHDEMPGYRYGITERVTVKPYAGMPNVELPATLPPERAANYRWFQENAVQIAGQKGVALPNAWFAWGRHRGKAQIVYSEQCVAADLCLRLQRWPHMEEVQ